MYPAKIKYISSMLIFGSIGLFVRVLPFPSSQIALGRGCIGCLFLLVFVFFFRKGLSFQRIRSDLRLLLFSGIAIGINWTLLFQSYRYTSISNATICYYCAPVMIVLLSPLVLKEKLNLIKICCVGAALVGMVLITGFGGQGSNDTTGILYGLGAAVFYAAVVLLNRFFRHVTNIERTIVQLAAATLSLFPYVFLTSPLDTALISIKSIFLLLTVGIIHTGLSYFLYFSGLGALKGQTAAIFSYIDPLTAICLSALLLKEPMGPLQTLGSILILGSTLVTDFWGKKDGRFFIDQKRNAAK